MAIPRNGSRRTLKKAFDWIDARITDALASVELLVLDSASAANSGTGKAVITGTSGALAIAGDVTIGDGKNIAANTGTGTKIGTATSQKFGFWNATPIIQPAGATQAAVSTTVGSAVAATGATNSSPYGFTGAAQADAIVANINTIRTDLLAIAALQTAMRTAMVNAGLMKGAA